MISFCFRKTRVKERVGGRRGEWALTKCHPILGARDTCFPSRFDQRGHSRIEWTVTKLPALHKTAPPVVKSYSTQMKKHPVENPERGLGSAQVLDSKGLKELLSL